MFWYNLVPINRWMVIGFLTMVVGFLLITVMVGIVILPIGVAIFAFGFLKAWYDVGKRVVELVRRYREFKGAKYRGPADKAKPG